MNIARCLDFAQQNNRHLVRKHVEILILGCSRAGVDVTVPGFIRDIHVIRGFFAKHD